MGVHKNIMVAVDFSDINRAAVDRAANMARLNESTLTLLYVIEHFPLGNGPLGSVFGSQIDPGDSIVQEATDKLEALAETLDSGNVNIKVSITSKSARSEILRMAEELSADLIIVAPHGQGIIGSMGSTATGVINNANCDVMAVREAQ